MRREPQLTPPRTSRPPKLKNWEEWYNRGGHALKPDSSGGVSLPEWQKPAMEPTTQKWHYRSGLRALPNQMLPCR